MNLSSLSNLHARRWMRSELAACAVLLAFSGCGNSTMTIADGGAVDVDGSSPDFDSGGDVFDPGVTYPGEGDSCTLSIECAARQVCVDEFCTRHERVDASELVLGEVRVVRPAEVATAGPALASLRDFPPALGFEQFQFYVLEGSVYEDSFVFFVRELRDVIPTGTTGAYERDRDLVAVFDDELRLVRTPGLIPQAAARMDDGTVIVGGWFEHRVVRVVAIARSGDVSWTFDFPDTELTRVRTETGDAYTARSITSIVVRDGRVYASAQLALPPDPETRPGATEPYLTYRFPGRTVVWEIEPTTGASRVLPVDDRASFASGDVVLYSGSAGIGMFYDTGMLDGVWRRDLSAPAPVMIDGPTTTIGSRLLHGRAAAWTWSYEEEADPENTLCNGVHHRSGGDVTRATAECGRPVFFARRFFTQAPISHPEVSFVDATFVARSSSGDELARPAAGRGVQPAQVVASSRYGMTVEGVFFTGVDPAMGWIEVTLSRGDTE